MAAIATAKTQEKHVGHPAGETEFLAEDKVLAFVKRTSEQALRKML
jgi:hypothetical protein